MKCEIDIDLPKEILDEWEPVAFRGRKDGERFISDIGHVLESFGPGRQPRLILRRKATYRKPTIEDIENQVEAEFSGYCTGQFRRKLCGFRNGQWIDELGCEWKTCRIKVEPKE